ncbi:MAG TPA: PAS domain-containing protein, partial [Paludibacter sp.]|nr:PAS domain-containing protein [Paludibacter sp.]
MSEFTNTAELRAEELANYMQGLLQGENGLQLIEKHALKTSKFIPHDIVSAFDILLDKQVSIEELKFVSNKLFNILYQTILEYPAIKPAPDSILDIYTQDNALALAKLKDMREHIKAINKQADIVHIQALTGKLIAFEQFFLHYTVIENVVFPVLETKWKHHQCVKIMWSFHDDIRRNVRRLIDLLSTDKIDIKEFNSVCGMVFFNVNTIILREEKIIFPMLLETLTDVHFGDMLQQTIGIGLPYAELKQPELNNKELIFSNVDKIHLPTGVLTAEQFNLIFNHLPVDITYVDENDTVRFYSNPPHRIFPRTPAIVGRKVQFCHPPESVHVVERIVQSFRTGEKDVASFWFHMGQKFILI